MGVNSIASQSPCLSVLSPPHQALYNRPPSPRQVFPKNLHLPQRSAVLPALPSGTPSAPRLSPTSNPTPIPVTSPHSSGNAPHTLLRSPKLVSSPKGSPLPPTAHPPPSFLDPAGSPHTFRDSSLLPPPFRVLGHSRPSEPSRPSTHPPGTPSPPRGPQRPYGRGPPTCLRASCSPCSLWPSSRR